MAEWMRCLERDVVNPNRARAWFQVEPMVDAQELVGVRFVTLPSAVLVCRVLSVGQSGLVSLRTSAPRTAMPAAV